MSASLLVDLDIPLELANTSGNTSPVKPPAQSVTAADLRRLDSLRREQVARLSVLKNRVEALNQQEQRCWKDVRKHDRRHEIQSLACDLRRERLE